MEQDSLLQKLKFALTETEKPSVFFEQCREQNKLDIFPELKALIGIPQSEAWHQEGDAWTHTMMVLDEASLFSGQSSDKFGFMMAALCHDFGKAVCTETINGKTHALKHEIESVPLTEQFLERLPLDSDQKEYIVNLVALHMKPHHAYDNQSHIKKTNQMFFEAKSPEDLVLLAVADTSGKLPRVGIAEEKEFLLNRLAVFQEYMQRPYVTDKDILNMGVRKDTLQYEAVTAYAHKLRMAGVNKEDALKQTSRYAEKGWNKERKDSVKER